MSLREKLDDFYTKYILGVGEKKEDEALVSIPLGIIIFSPWGIMIEKLRPFMRFAVIFAVLLSLVSMAGGGAYVCRFNNENLSVGFYCRSGLFAYFADILLYWGGLSFFAVAWRQVLVGNPFSLKQVFSSGSRRRKVLFPEPGVSFGRDNPLAFPVYFIYQGAQSRLADRSGVFCRCFSGLFCAVYRRTFSVTCAFCLK